MSFIERNCDHKWSMSSAPTQEEMQGEFEVKILTGFFKKINMTKEWTKKMKGQIGQDIRDGKKSGVFIQNHQVNTIMFDYGLTTNNLFRRRLIDLVRKTSEGEYIGKIYVKGIRKHIFMGYFSLAKV